MNLPSLVSQSAGFLRPTLIRSALPVLLASSISSSQESQQGYNNTSDTNSTEPILNPEETTQPASPDLFWESSGDTNNTTTTHSLSSRMDQAKQLFTQPRPRAILYMASAMALHFGGYEFVRSSMLALFTSNQVGFSNPGAFPLAMGLASPFSFLLLMGYGNVLERKGPRAALQATTLFSILVFAGTALLLQLLLSLQSTSSNHLGMARKALVALAFVYQNSYAHLLYTQHWSFLSSVMTPKEGSIWFSSIAGLSSIICTMTGTMVKPLVNSVGLVGTVACNCIFLVLSLICCDRAYQLSETHGFDPAKIKQNEKSAQNDDNNNNNSSSSNNNLVWKAKDLFQRVPTLGALFGEVLTFQSMSVILNIAMVTRLKQVMPNDNERAAWTGSLFAGVSGLSGVLQFVVIPMFLQRIEPRLVWKVMPLVPFMFSLYQSFQGASPDLFILALSFFAAKTMDYSIRGVVNEMVYQPLDFDSRYLGKEIIGVLGSRFGKSGVSLLMSGLAYVFPQFGIYHLSKLSVLASAGWLTMSWWLSALVPRKDEAQAAFLEQRRSSPPQSPAKGATVATDGSATKDKEE
ncbi:expressed unknown protein [Seminavis robusta]|uniref:ADP,ATP carrier protein n=1 Tax=Seminavis robusta TaxID=568900 RepID=A0A9N8DB32_9STRA|nr:expressed unknown protein [Seminavis robusta]|eukprot:Sro40_g024690.1 n/a (576) ;mRNA; r:78065-79792